MKSFGLLLSACVISLLLLGCDTTGLRGKGGTVKHKTPTGAITEVQQPENPKDATSQETKTEEVKELVIPAGSIIEQKTVSRDDSGKLATNATTITVSSNTVMRTVVKDESKATLGGAHVDQVGVMVAKLKSVRWMTIFGAITFLGGLFASFWPASRAVLGGTTPGLIVAGGGLVLAVVPYVLIGNETLVITIGTGIVLAIIAGIFLYRHGGHGREIHTLREFIDRNNNGVDDREESDQ